MEGYIYPIFLPVATALERVQRRFTKYLRGFGNYTYSERLHLLKLPSLELRRLHIDVIKILFGLLNLSPSDFCSS